MNKETATICPDCGWRTMMWVEAAPGPSDWICKVCELYATIDLYKDSKNRLHSELLERLEKAEKTLKRMSDEAYDKKSTLEGLRLEGKAQGLRVAISYMRE